MTFAVQLPLLQLSDHGFPMGNVALRNTHGNQLGYAIYSTSLKEAPNHSLTKIKQEMR